MPLHPTPATKAGRQFMLNTPSVSKGSTALPRRPAFNLEHGHDSDEDEDEGAPAFESVTGFDTTGKAVGEADAEEKQPLTIPVASGNNWRDRPGVNRRPKGKNLLPREVQAMQEAERTGKAMQVGGESVGPSMSYGLSLAKKAEGEEGTCAEDQKMEDAPAAL